MKLLPVAKPPSVRRNSPKTFIVPLLVIVAAAKSMPPVLMLNVREAGSVKAFWNSTILPKAIDQLMFVLVNVPADRIKVTNDEPPVKLIDPMPEPVLVSVPPV